MAQSGASDRNGDGRADGEEHERGSRGEDSTVTASPLRALRAGVAQWSGLNWLARHRLDGRRAAILNYHRVLTHEEARRSAVDEGMFVSPSTFASQLDWLVENFRVLPLAEIVDAILGDSPLPARACAITFDDGWRDNLIHALPALEARGLPGTLFVVTGRIGSNGAFWPDEMARILRELPAGRRSRLFRRLGVSEGGADPLYALLEFLKDVPVAVRDAALAELRAEADGPPEPEERVLLDWSELDRMAEGGVAIEAHGETHDMLTALDDEAAMAELAGSRRTLLERGHGRAGLFAYPAGRHDARVCRLTAEAGFRAAFTIERRVLGRDADPFAMPRLMLHEGMSATRSEFLLRVPGWS